MLAAEKSHRRLALYDLVDLASNVSLLIMPRLKSVSLLLFFFIHEALLVLG